MRPVLALPVQVDQIGALDQPQDTEPLRSEVPPTLLDRADEVIESALCCSA
jgi:hypothetical protein